MSRSMSEPSTSSAAPPAPSNIPKSTKNPWKNTFKLQALLEESLRLDFERVIRAYVRGNDKSYSAFCKVAQEFGVTLSFHWCAPNTTKKPCRTREYSDKVIYLILITAKRFWLCSSNNEFCRFHPGNSEDRFWRQVGGLFLIHILYGNQPTARDKRVQIDMGIRDIISLNKFLDIVKERVGTTSDVNIKKFYQGLQYLHARLKGEGAFRPTVLEFELGVNLLNFKN